MTIEAALAKKLSRLQNPDDSFLTLVRNDRELDLSLLNVEYRIRDISLREHVLTFAKLRNRFSGLDLGKEGSGIKQVLRSFHQGRSLVRWTVNSYHTTL